MPGPFTCPKCKTPTWGALDHCPTCGHALNTKCVVCGAKWRYFYHYQSCPSCGMKAAKEKEKVSQ